MRAKDGQTVSGFVALPRQRGPRRAFVDDVHTALAVSTPNKCQSAKIKATGKKSACVLHAIAKATKAGEVADPSTCEAKFASAFAKRDALGGCATTADADAVEGTVDAFVSNVVNALANPCASKNAGDPCGGSRCPTNNGSCRQHCNGQTTPLVCVATAGNTNTCSQDSQCAQGVQVCAARDTVGGCMSSKLAPRCAITCT